MRGGSNGKVLRRLCASLICAALALAPIATNADNSNPNLTLGQYEAELDRLASAVSALPKHADQIEGLRKSLPAGWQVQAGGEKYEVSSAWLASALAEIEKSPADRKVLCDEAAEQLKNLRAEAERAGAGGAGVNYADAHAQVAKILSEREYSQAHESTWLSKVWDQVQRWIDWVLNRTVGRLLGQGALRTTVLYAILIGVFLCVAVWVVRSLTSIVRSESLRVDASYPAGKHWRDWVREALNAAGRGDYRAALHAAYWAGVFRLAELGAWQLDRARTPREYLRMLNEQQLNEQQRRGGEREVMQAAQASDPAGRTAALGDLTRRMEASWYGYLPATEQDFDNAVNDLETLGCRLRSTALTAKS
jgi:hypothetical protein